MNSSEQFLTALQGSSLSPEVKYHYICSISEKGCLTEEETKGLMALLEKEKETFEAAEALQNLAEEEMKNVQAEIQEFDTSYGEYEERKKKLKAEFEVLEDDEGREEEQIYEEMSVKKGEMSDAGIEEEVEKRLAALDKKYGLKREALEKDLEELEKQWEEKV